MDDQESVVSKLYQEAPPKKRLQKVETTTNIKVAQKILIHLMQQRTS